MIKSELLAKEKKENPANFGYMCAKHCICEIMGQVPCPTIVPVPEYTRGKWRIANIPHKLRYFNYKEYDEDVNVSYELIPRKPRKPEPKT